MDHLSLSTEATNARTPVKILWLGLLYDGKGFQGFPERLGFSESAIFRGDFRNASTGLIRALLQSWLFFGFLDEFINSFRFEKHSAKSNPNSGKYDLSLRMDDFVALDGDTGKRILDTSLLPEYVEKWKKCLKASSQDEVASAAARTFEICSKLRILAFRFLGVSATKQEQAYWPLDQESAAAIVMLGEMLSDEACNAFPQSFDSTMSWPFCPFLVSRLKDRGYCAFDIRIFEGPLDNRAFYVLGDLASQSTNKDHSGCSDKQCVANQIDPDSYVPKHAHEHCTCSFREVDNEKVLEIISNGRVPIIKLTREHHGSHGIAIQLQEVNLNSKQRSHYVAISHVWSDGLGNSHENKMYGCQFVKMLDLILPLLDSDRSASFWIDTLCVPIDNVGRKAAIRSMASIYQFAFRVLVLDVSLQQVILGSQSEWEGKSSRYKKDRILEIVAYVHISPWLKRLWTLQEGALNDKLFIQFSDRAIQLETLLLEWYNEFSGRKHDLRSTQSTVGGDREPFCIDLFDQFSRSYNNMRCVSRASIDMHFNYLAESLYGRSTSKKEDEPLCIATLLGIDIKPIQDAAPALRMAEIMRRVESFPSGILFQGQPRCECKDGSWIPNSLLGSPSQSFQRGRGQSSVVRFHPKGYGWTLETSAIVIPLTDDRCLRSHWPVITWQSDDEDPEIYLIEPIGHDKTSFDGCLAQHGPFEAAVLISTLTIEDFDEFWGETGELRTNQYVRGLLTTVVEKGPEDCIAVVKVIASVLICRPNVSHTNDERVVISAPGVTFTLSKSLWDPPQILPLKDDSFLFGFKFPSTARWCLI